MRQKKRVGGKVGTAARRNTTQTQPSRLRKAESWAQIVTAAVLSLTLIAAGIAAIAAGYVAYITYKDYQAKARPYLAIEKLEFYEANGDPLCLVIGLTNFGERPATNVSIEALCVQSVSPEACLNIKWAPVEKHKDTIVFPKRINSIRIDIDKTDYQDIYQDILEAGTLAVSLQYSAGDKEYSYKADVRLHPGNVWHIESDRGN